MTTSQPPCQKHARTRAHTHTHTREPPTDSPRTHSPSPKSQYVKGSIQIHISKMHICPRTHSPRTQIPIPRLAIHRHISKAHICPRTRSPPPKFQSSRTRVPPQCARSHAHMAATEVLLQSRCASIYVYLSGYVMKVLMYKYGHMQYRVAKTHRMPHLHRSFSAKEPYN